MTKVFWVLEIKKDGKEPYLGSFVYTSRKEAREARDLALVCAGDNMILSITIRRAITT